VLPVRLPRYFSVAMGKAATSKVAVIEPYRGKGGRSDILVARIAVARKPQDKHTLCRLLNFHDEELNLRKGTPIAEISFWKILPNQMPVDDSIMNAVDKSDEPEPASQEKVLQSLGLTRKLCYHKDDRAMRAIKVDREPLPRYGHSKLSKMAAAAILNLFESKIAPLDPPPRKLHPITKHEVDRTTGCRDMAI